MPSIQIASVGVPNGRMQTIPQPFPYSNAGLLRSMPQGILTKPPQSVSNPIPTNLILPHSVNSITQRNYPTSSFSNVIFNYPPSPQTSSSDFKTSLPPRGSFPIYKPFHMLLLFDHCIQTYLTYPNSMGCDLEQKKQEEIFGLNILTE